MIKGRATPKGTARYHKRLSSAANAARDCQGLCLSSIGIGTYGVSRNRDTDREQTESLILGLSAGFNLIDTAPNYFDGAAEINVGRAIRHCVENGLAERDEIFVATKAGLLQNAEIAGGKYYNFDPGCLRQSIENSLNRLGLESADCVFLHNLEILKAENGEVFAEKFAEISGTMEEAVGTGAIRAWGVSSWSGFRVPPGLPEYLNLNESRELAGSSFQYLQFPFGLWAPEAATEKYQDGRSLFESAKGLTLFGNAALLQGELLPALEKYAITAEDAVLFAGDAPGIGAILLGVTNPAHMKEWIRARRNWKRVDARELVGEIWNKLKE
ncbi:MAG: aldo/keto reductase [Desulfovibrio sp.]|nr:aldo/keto reductase [Desulfovibrio sp.]